MTEHTRTLIVSSYEENSFPRFAEEKAIGALNNLQNVDILNVGSNKKVDEIADRMIQNLITYSDSYVKTPIQDVGKQLLETVQLVSYAFNTKRYTKRLLKKNVAGVMTKILFDLNVSGETVKLITEVASFLTLAVTVSPALYNLVESDADIFNRISTIMFESISFGDSDAAFAALQLLNRMTMQAPTLLFRITQRTDYQAKEFLQFLLDRMAVYDLGDLDALDVFLHLMDSFVSNPGKEILVDMFVKCDLSSKLLPLVTLYKKDKQIDPLKICAILDVVGGIIELARSSRLLSVDQIVKVLNDTMPSNDPEIRESGVSLIDAITECEEDLDRLKEIILQTNAVEVVLTKATEDMDDVNISSQFASRILNRFDSLLDKNIDIYMHSFLSMAFTAILDEKDMSSKLTSEEIELVNVVMKLMNISFTKIGDKFIKKIAESLFNGVLVMLCIDKSAQARAGIVLIWNEMLRTVSMIVAVS